VHHTRAFAACATALLITASASLGSAQSGSLEPHPTAGLLVLDRIPANATSGYAFGANDVGDVVGFLGRNAMRWTRDGSAELLTITPFFSGDEHTANAINDRGQIAGSTLVQESRQSAAWRLEPDGTQLTLSTAGIAWDINEAGVVVGGVRSPEGWRAARWDADGVLDFVGGLGTVARAINDSNEFVGTEFTDPAFIGSAGVPVRWDADGNLTYLATPAGHGRAEDINATGEVVGSVGGSPAHWTQDGQLQVLPMLGAAQGVNDSGLAVINVGGAASVWDVAAGSVLTLPLGDHSASQGWDLTNDGVVAGYCRRNLGGDNAGAYPSIWLLDGLPPAPPQAPPLDSTTTTHVPTSAPSPGMGPSTPAAPVAAAPRFTG
jgi:uncharacterized membrane protein